MGKLLAAYYGMLSEAQVALPRSWRQLPRRAKAWAEVKRGRREVFLRRSMHVIGVYRGCQFDIAQWKVMGGAGKQEAGKT